MTGDSVPNTASDDERLQTTRAIRPSKRGVKMLVGGVDVVASLSDSSSALQSLDEKYYALDYCGSSFYSVAPRYDHELHNGWYHPHIVGFGNHHGARANNPGAETYLVTSGR